MNVKEEHCEDGSSMKYFYSEPGQLLRLEDYSAEGRLTMIIEYRYDKRSHNVERIVTDANGRQIRRLEFEFDSDGKEIVQREYDAANVLRFTRKL